MQPDRFKSIRKGTLKLEQAELAGLLEVHVNTISNYETGKAPVPATVEFALYWLAFRELLAPLLAMKGVKS